MWKRLWSPDTGNRLVLLPLIVVIVAVAGSYADEQAAAAPARQRRGRFGREQGLVSPRQKSLAPTKNVGMY